MSNFTIVVNVIVFGVLIVLMLRYTFKYAEQSYAETKKKPFFLNAILFKKDLRPSQKLILERQFSFYKQLNDNEKSIFRHRVKNFIADKKFYGREGIMISEEIKVLISATAVMLTFGFRRYLLPIIHTILVYPEAFHSKQNNQSHKGEVNPRLGVAVFSWKDFKHGFDIENDNLNLGIHEFGHAIHLNSLKEKDVSSQIFIDNFNMLKSYLRSNEAKRQQLLSTKYFREYAYTNEFEFAAVLIECFIETPEDFKSNFPKLYNYVKSMINFNFAYY